MSMMIYKIFVFKIKENATYSDRFFKVFFREYSGAENY